MIRLVLACRVIRGRDTGRLTTNKGGYYPTFRWEKKEIALLYKIIVRSRIGKQALPDIKVVRYGKERRLHVKLVRGRGHVTPNDQDGGYGRGMNAARTPVPNKEMNVMHILEQCN